MDASYYKKYEPIFGAWKIKKKLGEGNFGAVFEIEREDFGTTYHAALKAITIPKNESELESIMDDGMDASATQEYLEQFVEKIVGEFVLMSKLKGNSNVVSYEDHQVVKHENGVGWDILIRMELLTPMLSYFKTNNISKRDIIKLGIDMCKALELCQKYNIIHRDIKPENIFISDSGDYKLGDFGIAKEVEKTQSGLTKTGTPTYMAPEVYKGQPYGSSVDLYSLGVVLYRLLNHNRAPFMPQYPKPISYKDKEKAFIMRVSGQKFPMPSNAGSGRLAEIAMKACSYKPEDRYSSPTQMREDLEAILYTEGEGTIMFPGGDRVEVKSVGYVSEEKSNKHIDVDDQTELTDDDSTELLDTSLNGKKNKAPKKKWLMPLIALICVVIIGIIGVVFLSHKNDIPLVYDKTLPELEQVELIDPIEFSIDVLHMNEYDFNLITKRLDTYGVKYTANKNTKTFAVSRNDLGTTEDEITASIEMITGVGSLMFSDAKASSENSIMRTDIESAYVDKEASQFVIELNDDGKNKLDLLVDETVDSGNSYLSLFIDRKDRHHAYVDQNDNIVIDMPTEIINDDVITLFSIKASAAEFEPSDNFIKLIISVIVNGEMTKEYNIYIDEKYGITIEGSEPIEDDENKEDDEKIPDEPIDDKKSEDDEQQNTDDKQEDTTDATQQPPEVTVNPTPICNVCGSTWHTVHPSCSVCGSTSHMEHPMCSVCGSTEHTVHPSCKICGSITHTVHPTCPTCGSNEHSSHPTCAICGSTEHTVHPTCPTCGSIEHTTHPAEQTPPTSSENAGMPEIYIDFD